MPKAGIYDPYLDTLGGGERYCLTVAEILLKHGYQVDLFWSGDPDLIAKAQDRFSLNLKGLNLVPDCFNTPPSTVDLVDDPQILQKVSRSRPRPSPLSRLTAFINKVKATRQYDLFFYLSDGSVPFLFSKNNLLHLQVPFHHRLSVLQKLLNRLKFRLIDRVVCNSKFTQKFINRYYQTQTSLLYPPVDVDKFTSAAKENIILSVGRFDNIMNAKKQDVLIDAFKKMYRPKTDSSWRLVLAGGSLSQPDRNSYLQHLYNLAQDLPVDIVVNPSFDQLKDLYSKAKIYWHAAGYNINEDQNPESTEHFGITVVEAMSAGLVPLPVKRGGLPEIITDSKDGYLWETIDDLIAKTRLLMASPQAYKDMSDQARQKCTAFSKDNFETNLLALISK